MYFYVVFNSHLVVGSGGPGACGSCGSAVSGFKYEKSWILTVNLVLLSPGFIFLPRPSTFFSSSLSFSCSLFQPGFSLSDGGSVSSTDYSSWPSYYNLLREQYNFAFLYMYRWWLYIMLSYLLKMCPNKSCGYGKKSLYFVTTIQKSVLAKRTR